MFEPFLLSFELATLKGSDSSGNRVSFLVQKTRSQFSNLREKTKFSEVSFLTNNSSFLTVLNRCLKYVDSMSYDDSGVFPSSSNSLQSTIYGPFGDFCILNLQIIAKRVGEPIGAQTPIPTILTSVFGVNIIPSSNLFTIQDFFLIISSAVKSFES